MLHVYIWFAILQGPKRLDLSVVTEFSEIVYIIEDKLIQETLSQSLQTMKIDA